MKSLRRLVLALLAVVVGPLAMVGLATAAHAAPPSYKTKAAIQLNFNKRSYNQSFSVRVQIQVPSQNAHVDDNHGSFKLQSRITGGSWKTIGTSSQDSGRTWTMKATRNTMFRAVYSGYQGSDYHTTAATSSTVTEKVTRNLHDGFNRKTFVVSGTVAPAFSNSTITLQRSSCSSGCAWHKLSTFKTNGKSHYSHKLPLFKNATYFRLMIPSGTKFVTSYSNHWFETYHI